MQASRLKKGVARGRDDIEGRKEEGGSFRSFIEPSAESATPMPRRQTVGTVLLVCHALMSSRAFSFRSVAVARRIRRPSARVISMTSALDDADGKQVAVIGAGASGLVSARYLIDAGLRPTIYDSAKAVGGAWTPADREDQSASYHPAGKMWSGLRTNLSKLTCRFSDWPWSDDASTFPTEAEMNEYLTGYAQHYLFDACKFQLESMVVSVKQIASQDGTAKYNVEWQDLTSQKRIHKVFDGVVVASGFFRAPRLPEFVGKLVGETGVIHSSEYKSHETFKGKRVAVVGSSFSALEIAADLAQSASRIVSICSSVPWVLPRWVSDSKGTVLPIDMVLFKRSHAFPQEESVHLTPESCRQRHRFLKSIVGEKQLNSDLGEPSDWDEPAHVAISNDFLDLVREHRIEVVHGRLEGICEDGSLRVVDSNTGNESGVEGKSARGRCFPCNSSRRAKTYRNKRRGSCHLRLRIQTSSGKFFVIGYSGHHQL